MGEPLPELTYVLTPAEEQAELTRLAAPLIQQGLPAGLFDRTAVLRANYTYKGFLKHLQTVSRLVDQDIIVDALSLGVKKDFFPLPNRMNISQFCRFSEWLRSKDGQNSLHEVQRHKKLEKKAAGVLEPREVALEQIFSAQRADWAAAKKEERSAYDKEIQELRKKIRQLERRWERREVEIDNAFDPQFEFLELDEAALNERAYAMYVHDCQVKERRPRSKEHGGVQLAVEAFGGQVKKQKQAEFAREPEVAVKLFEYAKRKILSFEEMVTSNRKPIGKFTWMPRVETYLLSRPVKLRKRICSMCPVGLPPPPGVAPGCQPLSKFVREELLVSGVVEGTKKTNPLLRAFATVQLGAEVLRSTRVLVHHTFGPETQRRIPVARSRIEAGLRRIIGGGAMRGWDADSKMFRGGGNSSDALLLLGQCDDNLPGGLLREHFSLLSAKRALSLPGGLRVPDGPECLVMKNFNNDATAGPFLRAFGIKGKYGLKKLLEDTMWWFYDAYGRGEISDGEMPHFAARVGFRTKLVSETKAWEKLAAGAPVGRAVMMLDALEQAASSPLYNVMSNSTYQRRLERDCGFKNGIVKASSDWAKIWEDVREAKAIIELDWSKFDRERPADDILFVIEVVLSCFEPTNDRERRLLRAFGLMMRRALVERIIVMDDGGVFEIDGMVPSGSLWTGWLDTALNVLYLNAACMNVGIGPLGFSAMCAGDDNLTLFWTDHPDHVLKRIKDELNGKFRAGISDEDFFIHRPPFHVTKQQACFPPGTDLSHGTSKLMDLVFWQVFDGEVVIDEAAGRSHRWEYVFKGRPKFLSCYWLPGGQPIRPTSDNMEKLLWPEGIHEDIDDYQATVMAMVVDNPWNHHCVNHLLMRYVILQQLRRVDILRGGMDDVLFLCACREKGGGPIPYPMVAPWRRSEVHGRMEDYEEVKRHIQDFSDFVTGVTSLYSRTATGGVDSWLFMNIIRGEQHVGEGQYGNDLMVWVSWIRDHPCTRYLKSVRGLRTRVEQLDVDPGLLQKATIHYSLLRETLVSGRIETALDFARWVRSIILGGHV
ncbi:TPA_inf: ORF1+2p [Erigeron breviscapus amalgavirus 1]|uniref:ORF1+2p n=1 Tax=Erigeron breviscapus amalgavirus 1 TaxID=2069322 RepID=UPI000DC1D039|nr:ORF1+2p [Erigeron breviscapus amalgavirus 1]DAB41681.1 TPA_inf: ORF1+2p [Erigeron breviscapus amalgavirus 1]